jgi:hypothetical protein
VGDGGAIGVTHVTESLPSKIWERPNRQYNYAKT